MVNLLDIKMALNFDHMHAQTVLVYGTVSADTMHTASNNTQRSFLAVDMSSCPVAYLYWHGRCAADCARLYSPVPTYHWRLAFVEVLLSN
jgi:hypothetical protein